VNPCWIKTEEVRLAIIPRPRGQDWLPDDISLLLREEIDVVVSALTAADNVELVSSRKVVAAKAEVSSLFPSPIEDRSVSNEFAELVNSVTDFLRKGKRLQFIAEPESAVRQ